MRLNQIALVAILLLVTAIASSQDKPADQAASSQEEIMAMVMKYGTPGQQHASLKPLEGTFDAEVTMQMTPDTPPQTSVGKMKNKMILDGRFLKGSYEGDFAGQQFQGISLFGYDNMKQKYVSLWTDSMSTGLMMSEGTADASGKVITFMCTYDCPITGGKKTMKQVTTIIDDNKHTYETYDVAADGKEFKTMTIKYTRAKEQA